jgi:hypothetical protein
MASPEIAAPGGAQALALQVVTRTTDLAQKLKMT